MPLFPMFLKLDGRRCVVVGAGKIAAPKIASLLRARAKVVVVAPRATRAVTAWSRAGTIRWHRRKFAPRDLEGATLVIAATNAAPVNAQVFREARRRTILCNSVDDPAHCDFYYSAVVRRDPLQIAISTNGASPALASRLRRELEIQFPASFGEWVAELGKKREELFAQRFSVARRRRILHRIASGEEFATFLKNRKRLLHGGKI